MSVCLQTGQITCHDARGSRIDCTGSGQDGDFKRGVPWPAPRFEVLDDGVLDRLTRLVRTRNANRAEFPLAWQEALGTLQSFPQYMEVPPNMEASLTISTLFTVPSY